MDALFIFWIICGVVFVVGMAVTFIAYRRDPQAIWPLPFAAVGVIALMAALVTPAGAQSSAYHNPDLAVVHSVEKTGLAALDNVVQTKEETHGSFFLVIGSLDSEKSTVRKVNYMADGGNDYTMHSVKLNGRVHLHETTDGTKPYMTTTEYGTKASSWYPWAIDQNEVGTRYDFWVPRGTITSTVSFNVDNSK